MDRSKPWYRQAPLPIRIGTLLIPISGVVLTVVAIMHLGWRGAFGYGGGALAVIAASAGSLWRTRDALERRSRDQSSG